MREIKLVVKQGRNLVSCDSNGLSDPFCELQIIYDETDKEGKKNAKHAKKKKTKTISKTLNPVWEQEFEFGSLGAARELHVSCYDKDHLGKDFMGHFSIPIEVLYQHSNQSVEQWFPLKGKKESDDITGEILLSIFCPNKVETNEGGSYVKKGGFLGIVKHPSGRRSSIPKAHEPHAVINSGGFEQVGNKKKRTKRSKLLKDIAKKEALINKKEAELQKKNKNLSSRDQEKRRKLIEKREKIMQAMEQKEQQRGIAQQNEQEEEEDSEEELTDTHDISDISEAPNSFCFPTAHPPLPSPSPPSSFSASSSFSSSPPSFSTSPPPSEDPHTDFIPSFSPPSPRSLSSSPPVSPSPSPPSPSPLSQSPSPSHLSPSGKKMTSRRNNRSRSPIRKAIGEGEKKGEEKEDKKEEKRGGGRGRRGSYIGGGGGEKGSGNLKGKGTILLGGFGGGGGGERGHEGVVFLDVEYQPLVKSGVECSDASVQITVKKCWDLNAKNPIGLVDPYVILHYGDKMQRTRYLKKTCNPEYNLQYKLPLPNDVKVINIEVWDWKRIGTDELIGQCSFSPSDCQPLPKVNSLKLELMKTKESRQNKVSKKKSSPMKQPTFPNSTGELLDAKRHKLLHACEVREIQEEIEKEKREKLQIMKQIEVRTWSTPVPIHSNEDPKVVYFLGFLVAFCTLNFLFHHFLWSLYSDAMVDVIDVVEDITGDLSELIQDLGKESVSALQNREVGGEFLEEVSEILPA